MMTQRTRRFVCLKLVAIVRVLDKKVEMRVYVHVNDNWSVVDDVVVQVFQVAMLLDLLFFIS